MDFLGIGPLELVFILIIILLVAGPKDIEKTARSIGRGLNRLYRSTNYQVIRRASQELRNLPSVLAREAQLEELNELKSLEKDLKDAAKIGLPENPYQAWVEPLPPAPPPQPGEALPPQSQAPQGQDGQSSPAPEAAGRDQPGR